MLVLALEEHNACPIWVLYRQNSFFLSPSPSMNRYLLLTTILVAACSMAEQPVSSTTFSREVLPILSDRCFHCHGPDPSHRKAKLRLDLEAEAKAERDGSWILKAGDPENSAIWQRIITDDPDELMPPPDSHREPLSQNIHAPILSITSPFSSAGLAFNSILIHKIGSSKRH